jgi:hypothetical protein
MNGFCPRVLGHHASRGLLFIRIAITSFRLDITETFTRTYAHAKHEFRLAPSFDFTNSSN